MSDKSKMQGHEPIESGSKQSTPLPIPLPIPLQSVSDQSISSLVRAIQSDEQEPLTCAECREHIASLYEANRDASNRAGATLSPELQAAALHVATCPDCAAEYEALAETMAAFASGSLPELTEPFQFDLSFLSTPPVTTQTTVPTTIHAASSTGKISLWRESIAHGVWTLGEEVRIRVDRLRLDTSRASFASLQDYLAPATSTGAQFRSEGSSGKAEVLILPAPEAEFSVHLAVGPIVADHAAVVLKFLGLSTAQPLANMQVTLRNGERQLLAGSMTGQDGSVLFENLAFGRYLIQVRHNQKVWEIPLMLIEGNTPPA